MQIESFIKNNLKNFYTIWYKYTNDSNIQNSNNKTINQYEYFGMVKKLVQFNTLDAFFNEFQYLKKPDEAKIGLEISLFKNDIKPMWEDEENRIGGKITFKIKKNMTNCIWDELALRIIGESFPGVNNSEINGIMYIIKKEFNIIQIWFRNFNNTLNSQISNSIKNIFNIPIDVELDIRQFNKPKVNNNNSHYNNFNTNYNKKN